MPDFLTRLVERTQSVAQVAQPIIPPMFAPVSPTLSEYSQHPTLDSEPLNALNSAMVTPPPDDSSSATLNQSFRKTSDNRFAPPRHIESVVPHPVNGLIEHGTSNHSSSPASPEGLTNSKRQKGNFFGDNESPKNKTVSEYDQNTSYLPEQSFDTKRGVSGRLIDDSDQLRAPRNLADAERNQTSGTQRNQHLLTEKRDASGGTIKSENVSVLQEMAETEGDQNSGLQPEHSRNKNRVAPEGAIDSDRASALREVTEPTEVESAETTYLKPHLPGTIRFQQATEMEPSSESTIKVTIGRVEVRAIMPPVPIATASHARTRSPTLSLDDYLKKRNEGEL
jgi:hypothetical protein